MNQNTKTASTSAVQEQKNSKETKDAKKEKSETGKPDKQKKSEDKATNKKLEAVTLVKAIDGDTIKVKYKGQEKTVRYLLVDTPETKKPNSCVQPYGKDASERNKELVNGGKLKLEFDKGDQTDKYGRLLAYVYVDGKSVQEKLLKEGLARVAYVHPPNTKYLDQFKEDEKNAKNKQMAIWSKSNYATEKGFNGCVSNKSHESKKSNSSKKSTSNKKSSTNNKPNPSNKSNTNKKSSPSNRNSSHSSASVPASGGTESFANCTELRKKYPHGVPSSHPAYQSKMDRDHDNYACERN
ncbi:thermonuclease family protein [Bacillus sp. CLL-7-23]|uniref:Thermonuclease family protein n=1 Tax=Bacillus changyiensis TaxID=3004103 RepID=A0ABT4X6C7_9BACI|nr:thermonuclease family protein [Bacillus changyiensis]MDA7027745.1 thermonuclease family protein [Bacillus changyiensis]